MAHIVIFGGRRYTMAVAEISEDRRSCSITPFSMEIHSTRFYNGQIEIKKDRDGLYYAEEVQKRVQAVQDDV